MMSDSSQALILYRVWLTDAVTGKRRLTSYRMTEADARERHGEDAVKDESSREERHHTGSAAEVGNRRPG
jgi:hypothetical protein